MKGINTYNVSVTQMLSELQWESLELCREQFCLVMLHNILKQNVYFPSEFVPEFCTVTCLSVPTIQTRSCKMFRLYLSRTVILMLTSTPLCHVHQDYGTPCIIKLLRLLQQTPSNHYYMIITLDLIVS